MTKRYFPWHLYRKFLFLILLSSLVSHFLSWDWISFLILSLATSAILSWLLVRPIARISLKALRLASKKQFHSLSQEEFAAEELIEADSGDYFELERALERIRRKLQKRRVQLAHEREESRALMGALQDAVVSINLEGFLAYFNSSFASQFLNRDLLAKVSAGKTAINTIIRHPDVSELFSEVLASGKTGYLTKKLVTEMDPEGRFFELTVSPLREKREGGAIYGALAVFHDISELKKTVLMRMEFVENASHELRTPLTSIKGYLEAAKEDLSKGQAEQAASFLDVVSKNVNRLIELVNDLLTISSLENKRSLRMERLDPMLITQDVVERILPQAATKNVTIKINSGVGSIAMIKGDSASIEQVLVNLLHNAIKYVPSGALVEVRWSSGPGPGQVQLLVKDNGPGIAPEHLGRLFERFYRIDKGRHRDAGGTGLGLAIVKHIVQSHGGSVSVKSELGRGSEFQCIFPSVI